MNVRPRLLGPECLFILDIRLTTSSESRSQERPAPPGGASNYYCFHPACHPGVVGVCGRGGPPALERLVARLWHMGYLSMDFPSVETLTVEADRNLFKSISQCPSHILWHLLTDKPTSSRYLRVRAHDFVLPPKDNRNFLSRVLYNAICLPMGDA